MASLDLNNILYPYVESEPTGEGHAEPFATAYLSNEENAEHPLFSPKGLMQNINAARNAANSFSSKDKELSGEIKMKVIEDVMKTAIKVKCPVDLLMFVMDFEKKMTDRSDGSDAENIAKKLLNNVESLRSTLGRDPQTAEMFASYVLGSASKVKEIFDKSQSNPDDEVKTLGTQFDDVLLKKNRNNKETQRTYRELYQFFWKRIPTGRNTFNPYVGNYGSGNQ